MVLLQMHMMKLFLMMRSIQISLLSIVEI